MKFYRLLDAIPWVRESLERKLGLVLFVGTQLTLVFYVAVKLLLDSPMEAGILLLVASFNLGSWVAAYIAMRFFLQPIEATADALRAYLERRPVEVLPQDGHDMFGQLMRDADYIGKRAELDSSQLQRAVDDDLLTGLYSRRAGKRRLLEDAARSERGKMKFHFAFFSLHGLSDIGERHGNEKLDALLQHIATLFKLNVRRSDWVARWNEHLFAVGFCDNNRIEEVVRRIHQVLEQSPFDVAPGEKRSPIVACGVCEHAPGMELQKFYEMARDAMRGAENAVKTGSAHQRVMVMIPEPVIDPELKAMLEK
jgi:diguanylate cyclase (GGDEF)-like protein